MALVTALVNERPVVIFSKSSCCMCYTIKTLISSFGANPTVFEVDDHPQGKQIEKELRGLGCKPSVPAVFIGEELIGGANEIMSLHLKGQLYEIAEHTNRQQMDKELKTLSRKPRKPAMFKGHELVGGSNKIMSLQLKDNLVDLLKRKMPYGFKFKM